MPKLCHAISRSVLTCLQTCTYRVHPQHPVQYVRYILHVYSNQMSAAVVCCVHMFAACAAQLTTQSATAQQRTKSEPDVQILGSQLSHVVQPVRDSCDCPRCISARESKYRIEQRRNSILIAGKEKQKQAAGLTRHSQPSDDGINMHSSTCRYQMHKPLLMLPSHMYTNKPQHACHVGPKRLPLPSFCCSLFTT